MRRLPIGAELQGGNVSFRLWAPRRKSVSVILATDGRQAAHAMEREEGGYFSLSMPAKEVFRYGFRLDSDEKLLPDPASRFQPEGPHGLSEVIDPERYRWTDQDWQGVGNRGRVLYEMHIGTFTREGSWVAALAELEALAALGITVLEVMPVAQFPGRFNWGYDGVGFFAPAFPYGRPDDFRNFVNRAHELGLGVILDLVCNHFGSDGNYLAEFSDTFFSASHGTDWGAAINFDGPGSDGVREYYLSNVRYWIQEYHIDGFRFDATQNIYDSSHPHILSEISQTARDAAGSRSVYLICENDQLDGNIVRPRQEGGYGMDGLWNDDFHHTAFVALAGRCQAFCEDYLGTPQELVSTAKWGYLYHGQFSRWLGKHRGKRSFELPAEVFVNYLENHDQVANFGHGARLAHTANPAELRAMTALWLLIPQVPMFFQGQEYGAEQHFNFFADNKPELASAVILGRARELGQFPCMANPEMLRTLPDPNSIDTFEGCKLDHAQRYCDRHALLWALHRDLLELRATDPVLLEAQAGRRPDGCVLSSQVLAIRFFAGDGLDRLLFVNLGADYRPQVLAEPLVAVPPGMKWSVLWSSESPQYGGTGTAAVENVLSDEVSYAGNNWLIPGKAAVFLKPELMTEAELEVEKKRICELAQERRERQLRIVI